MTRNFHLGLLLGFLVLTMTGLTVFLTSTAYAETRSEGEIAERQVALNLTRSTNPVDAVIGASEFLGFNPKTDNFTLVSETPATAIVRVIHDGINFNVTLEPSFSGSWTVVSMSSSI